jgi:hypothetical protein
MEIAMSKTKSRVAIWMGVAVLVAVPTVLAISATDLPPQEIELQTGSQDQPEAPTEPTTTVAVVDTTVAPVPVEPAAEPAAVAPEPVAPASAPAPAPPRRSSGTIPPAPAPVPAPVEPSAPVEPPADYVPDPGGPPVIPPIGDNPMPTIPPLPPSP